MYKIMLVEDEVKIRTLCKNYLEKYQYLIHEVTDFSQVLNDFIQEEPHLVILDINLPFMDGFYWCQQIREISSVPILFTSSRTGQMDVIMGIHMGADDYLYKPFDLAILQAKVTAMLRRAYAYHDLSLDLLSCEGAVLNLKDFSFTHQGLKTDLTKNEFLILGALMESPNTIFSRDQLMRRLWEDESFVDDNTLTVNMNRLRKKLGQVNCDHWIKTKKGQGYSLL